MKQCHCKTCSASWSYLKQSGSVEYIIMYTCVKREVENLKLKIMIKNKHADKELLFVKVILMFWQIKKRSVLWGVTQIETWSEADIGLCTIHFILYTIAALWERECVCVWWCVSVCVCVCVCDRERELLLQSQTLNFIPEPTMLWFHR